MSETHVFDEHTLESGKRLRRVPVAYHTWGALNEARDNVIVVGHALTGSSDAADWWDGLIGPGRALDTDRFFVICPNVLASPYGSASPLTANPDTGEPYGPDFPRVTIRDTVRLHRRLLDRLGVRRVVLATGGSMGGMQALEWAFEGDDFVEAIAPIAVNGRHAAWQIGWSEAQRQALYADSKWQGGNYEDDPPRAGLAAARMAAMVSYRSRASFEERFGRGRTNGEDSSYAVESYLRYQGEKLVGRFDANCYVRLTQQMDSHDVARGRGEYADVLRSIRQPALVVGIDTDVLYPLDEQRALAEHLPNATLEVLRSPHGHDAFLIETETLNVMMRAWMRENEIGPAQLVRS
jgi:homoserine O-acetyltransferase